MAFETIKESGTVQRAVEAYEKLTAKDQLMVRILIAFLSFVVVVFGMILPATRYHNAALSRYQENVATLTWMEMNKSRISASQAQSKRDSGQSLLSIANSSSKKFNISFNRYEPMGEDSLNLWLDDTVFNNMIVWLELLDKRHGIQVKEIAVDRRDSKGLVNVRLVLQG